MFVYAKPLYIEGGPGGRAMIIAVTESDNVYALDAPQGREVKHWLQAESQLKQGSLSD